MKPQDRVVMDEYGYELGNDRNSRSISKEEGREIRRLLKLNYHAAPYARCRHRDMYTAFKLDKKLGYDLAQRKDPNNGFHTKFGHVCVDCRCKLTAGQGTRGWWYWPKDNPDGYGEVGHHGVGPCWKHGPKHQGAGWGGRGLDNYTRNIMREIRTVQQHGMAPDATGAFMIQLKDEGDAAEMVNELRGALQSVKHHGENLVEWLDETKDSIDSIEDVDKCVRLKLKCSELTLKHLQAIAVIAKSEFDTSQGEYAHKDEVRLLITRFLRHTESIYRPKGTDEDWYEFSQGLKDILLSLRMGKQ